YPDSPCSARARKSFRPMNRRDHCTDVVYGSWVGPEVFPGMYEVSARKASPTASGCRQKNIPAPIGTENHLCASHVIESAAAMPARCGLRRGAMNAAPPHAAPTWSQRLAQRQNRASAGDAALAPAPVGPADPPTTNGAH